MSLINNQQSYDYLTGNLNVNFFILLCFILEL